MFTKWPKSISLSLMANDAQGYYSNLCHFSFVCWFKKMPQMTGRRKRLTFKEKPIECKLCDKKFLQHSNINTGS